MIQEITFQQLSNVLNSNKTNDKYIIFLLYRSSDTNIINCIEKNGLFLNNLTGTNGLLITINEGYPVELNFRFEQFEQFQQNINNNDEIRQPNQQITIYNFPEELGLNLEDLPCIIITDFKQKEILRYKLKSSCTEFDILNILTKFIVTNNYKKSRILNLFTAFKTKLSEPSNADKSIVFRILFRLCHI